MRNQGGNGKKIGLKGLALKNEGLRNQKEPGVIQGRKRIKEKRENS